MKKIIASSALLALSLALPVSAAPKAGFSLPARALEVSQGVFDLGLAYDRESDSFVEGYAIVHRKNDVRTSASRAPKSTKCYAVMADGAKWKSVEPWMVFDGAGLDANFLVNSLTSAIDTWEQAAVNPNILGTGTAGVGSIKDPNVLDNFNQVFFDDLNQGTIAVTIVWGTFGGPTFARSLVAWDQIYNTDYAWSPNGEADKMDFLNIATHELGHAMGLADIYNSTCSDVTMYGYGAYGETSKRTLESADITGINLLY